MYSNFYEIPLPALRFEKVEETDTKKWKNDTEEKRRENDTEEKWREKWHRRETTPSKLDKFDHVKKPKENDAQRKADSLARKRHAKKTRKRFQNKKHLL